MYYMILSLVFLLSLSTGEAATPVNSSQDNPPQNHSASIDSTQAAAIVDESAKDDQHFQDNLARDNPVQDYSVETNSDVEHQTEDQKEGQKEGKFPRLERQHTLGAIQRSWDKAGRQAGGLYRYLQSTTADQTASSRVYDDNCCLTLVGDR